MRRQVLITPATKATLRKIMRGESAQQSYIELMRDRICMGEKISKNTAVTEKFERFGYLTSNSHASLLLTSIRMPF